MSVFDDPRTWHELADLGWQASPGTAFTVTGVHDGMSFGRSRADLDDLFDRWTDLCEEETFPGTFVLEVHDDGRYRVTRFTGETEHDLLLDSGALPPPFRDVVPFDPSTIRDEGLGNTYAERLRTLLPAASPADPADLAAYGQALGYPVPLALAALWAVAEQGDVTLQGDPEDPDEDYRGFRLLPPGPDRLRYVRGIERASRWRYAAVIPLDLRPKDRVSGTSAGPPGGCPSPTTGAVTCSASTCTPGRKAPSGR